MTPKILIITLYAGEQEFEACKQSVRNQNYNGVIDHICFEHLDNITAHRTCYKTMMDRTDEYDLFIKLDADMVFNRPTAIADIVDLWNTHHYPDMISLAVKDHLSDSLIMGIHVFSNRCRWNVDTHDPLFIDPAPDFPGHRITTYDAPAPCVDHMPNPNDDAAFHYGFHRGIKMFQWGRLQADKQSYGALKTLLAVADHYKRTGHTGARTALMGAETARLKYHSAMTGDKGVMPINEVPIDFWLSPLRVKLYWALCVAPRIILGKYFGRHVNTRHSRNPA